jgi:hypothetical protein
MTRIYPDYSLLHTLVGVLYCISRIYKARAAPQIYNLGAVRISIAFIAEAAGLAARLQDRRHTLGLRC